MSRAFERNGSLCEPFLSVLPVTGAAVSVLNEGIGQATISCTDQTAAWLDELQFDLGEGPCWTALGGRAPVLRPRMEDSREEWPMFANAVADNKAVASMFAFPLALGTLSIGAVDLYTSTTTELDDDQVAQASELASLATWQVLRTILGAESAGLETSISSRREVHQATGMILVQVDTSADNALLLLRAHAFATGRSVLEVATDVVDRKLDFSTIDRPTHD